MDTMDETTRARFARMAARQDVEIVDGPPTTPATPLVERVVAYFEGAGFVVERDPCLFRLGVSHAGKNISIQPQVYLPEIDLHLTCGSFKPRRSALALMDERLPDVNIMLYNFDRLQDLAARVGEDPDREAIIEALNEQRQWAATRLAASFLLKKQRPAYKAEHAPETYREFKDRFGGDEDKS